MNINIGDKIFAKEDTWIADKGKVGVVTDIITDEKVSLISFKFDSNTKVSCTMDFDTFNHYFAKVEEVEAPRITQEYIDEIMEEAEFEVYTTFNKCTVVSCRLPNGFVITESSACVSPENYDEEIGFSICYDKIVNKVWELEAYLLQECLYEKSVEDDECPHGCIDCENCPCDGSYCE